MQARTLRIVLVLVSVILMVGLSWVNEEDPNAETLTGAYYHKLEMIDTTMYKRAYETAYNYDLGETVRLMIVPHHILSADRIAGMYKGLEGMPIDHVILLGPDHFGTSNRSVLTSDRSWRQMDDLLPINQAWYDQIKMQKFVFEDHSEIEVEHSIHTHIPFIMTYLPEVDLLPIAVSKSIRMDEVETMTEVLSGMISQNTLVIASVDFSHYLSLENANERDYQTKQLMTRGDIDTIMDLDDSYFDSPSILAMMLILSEWHGYEMHIVDHSNAAHYIDLEIPETTSYFFITFEE